MYHNASHLGPTEIIFCHRPAQGRFRDDHIPPWPPRCGHAYGPFHGRRSGASLASPNHCKTEQACVPFRGNTRDGQTGKPPP